MKKYALSLTSAFTTPSMLKARITMLFQKRSRRIAGTKFLLTLPVVLLCLGINACLQREMPTAQQTKTQGAQSPRVVLMKNAQGELVETIHFDGEKDNYEKVADAIGLNNFLENKHERTVKEVLTWYHKVVPLALSKSAQEEEAERMQSTLFGVLLQKNMHRSSRKEDIIFIAEGLLRHPYSVYFFLHNKESTWFETNLPTLQKYYAVDKLKEYAHKLSTVYQKILGDVLDTATQQESKMILNTIQKFATI
jgi:hypothetical protein